MKFSRFRFSVLLNVIILTQPVNIVKHFFLFYQLFAKSMWSFQCRLFCDSLIIISNCIRLVKNIFKLFSNFFIPADPLPRGCERKVCLLSSDSLSILSPFSIFVKRVFPFFWFFSKHLWLCEPFAVDLFHKAGLRRWNAASAALFCRIKEKATVCANFLLRPYKNAHSIFLRGSWGDLGSTLFT